MLVLVLMLFFTPPDGPGSKIIHGLNSKSSRMASRGVFFKLKTIYAIQSHTIQWYGNCRKPIASNVFLKT